MDTIFNFLKDNISWIKDIFTVVLASTAIVISILTYRKANATILQPIRNEVIKKQSKLLSDLLEVLGVNGIDKKIDYVNIATETAYSNLKLYGFVFKDDSKNNEEIQAGRIYCGESNIVRDVEVVSTFIKEAEEEEREDIGKVRFEELKNGIITIEWIYITSQYKEFLDKLHSYLQSPFLPSNIQAIVSQLLRDININLTIHLKDIIHNFIKDFGQRYFSKGEKPRLNFAGIYNDFNHIRINHELRINELRLSIREHLKIDQKW